MPKPKRNQLTSYKLFLKRQQQYEKRYQRYFYTYLRQSYLSAARKIKAGEQIDYANLSDNDRLVTIITKLYNQISLSEAIISYNEVLAPIEGNRLKTKDAITDLIELLSPNSDKLVNIWRSLLNNFLQVRLTNRITQINNTTNERIRRIIEQGIFDGLGAEEVARNIRKEAGGNLNAVRSRAIARTETITAANQGKYMSASSSNLEMKKKWIPATDARTRPSHRAMLDNPWIPLKEDFYLANDLGILEPAKHPCDNRLSASNTVNCRCAMVFEPMRDSNGNLIRKGIGTSIAQ